MHSRILKYLDEVVRVGSIRGAADKLNVAASAISRQILTLETELGTPIFQRTPKRLRLTTAGEILIAHVRTVLKEHDRTRLRILDLAGLRTGHVRVAAMNGLAGGVLADVLTAFSHKHPRVQVTIRSLLLDDLVAAVQDGEADIGLGYNLPQDADLFVMEIFHAQLGLALAPTHALAQRRTGVRPGDCADHPIVLADETMTIHRAVTNAFRRANKPLHPRFLTNSIELMKTIAMAGEAITFLSDTDIAKERGDGRLAFFPILDPLLDHQPLSLVHRLNAPLDLAPGVFAEALRAALATATKPLR